MIHSLYHFGDSSSPILALAIHNGHRLPDDLEAISGILEKQRRQEEDPFTGTIAELFANHIVVYDSRFKVDLNRPRERAVYQKPEDCWGLICRKQPLSKELLDSLLADYDAWYKVLAYQIERMLAKHNQLFVLDLHSYNHRRGGPNAAPDPQELNPDIILGRSNMDPARYPLIEKLRKRLDGQMWQGIKLDCRCDVKFPGGQLSRWIHDSYGDRVICLAVEFKKIWMDEYTAELDEPAFTELKQLFLDEFSGFALAHLSGGFS